MEIIEQAYQNLFVVVILLLALLIICCILRSAIGPRTADRIIAINMTGTMIIMIIAVLSVMLDQNYLVDICLIYAMISFLGVVVLCKIYTGVYLQKKHRKATLEAIVENIHEQQTDHVQCLSAASASEPDGAADVPAEEGDSRKAEKDSPAEDYDGKREESR